MSDFRDRVKDTTTTTGTGNITLAGSAPTGFVTFASVYATGTLQRIPYAIVHQSANEWEVGYGSLSASTTFVRDRVVSSSNAGAAVNFSAGTKDIWVDIPAEWMRETLPRGRIEMMRVGAPAY